MKNILNIPDLDLYYVNIQYVKYLYDNDCKKNGFSQVPELTHYSNTQRKKFFTGVVLNIKGFNYFAPVSSKVNILKNSVILIDGNQTIASVKLGYMIPVPLRELVKVDIDALKGSTYQRLVKNEIKSINSQKYKIATLASQVRAKGIKYRQINPNQHVYCDFLYLEKLCKQWEKDHAQANSDPSKDSGVLHRMLPNNEMISLPGLSLKNGGILLDTILTHQEIMDVIDEKGLYDGIEKALPIAFLQKHKEKDSDKDDDRSK